MPVTLLELSQRHPEDALSALRYLSKPIPPKIMNATLWAPEHTLTTTEESIAILSDVFDTDTVGMNDVLNELCEENSIAFDQGLNGDEIHSLIIENEDALYTLYANYLHQDVTEDVTL